MRYMNGHPGIAAHCDQFEQGIFNGTNILASHVAHYDAPVSGERFRDGPQLVATGKTAWFVLQPRTQPEGPVFKGGDDAVLHAFDITLRYGRAEWYRRLPPHGIVADEHRYIGAGPGLVNTVHPVAEVIGVGT